MTIEEQLRTLIDSAPLHIQRHFACDCAERVLRRAKVKDKRLWKAVEVARRYAEGRATMDELDAARWATRGARPSASHFSAWSAAWPSSQDAAWDAARFSTDEERAWQIAHLQYLLAAHNAARVQATSSFAQTLEEALFT